MRPEPSDDSIGSAKVPGSNANGDEPATGFMQPENSR